MITTAPKRTAVVLGSGIIGASVAWALAKQNINVVLVDNNPGLFQGVSKAGFGSLTPFSDPFYKGPTRAVAAEGVRLYKTSWLESILRTSGQSVFFQDLGLLQLCLNDNDIAKATTCCAELNSAGYTAKLLSAAETKKLEPNLTKQLKGSLWLDEPWMDLDQYFYALELAIRKNSRIKILPSTEVIAVEHHRDSITVRCSTKKHIEADLVIACTGLGTIIPRNLQSFNIRWIRGDAIAMYSSFSKQPLLRRHVYLHDAFITPRNNAKLLLGATYREDRQLSASKVQPPTTRIELKQFHHLIAANQIILPALERCEIGEVWRGWRPTPKDSKPIFGVIASQPRIVYATGFIGLGITMAPAVATITSRYAVNGDASVFPKLFNPERLM
jgi:glycine/D-amino acid oxidase-like deaminating enzyme